jgi:sortase (surface protein transpeptidase)
VVIVGHVNYAGVTGALAVLPQLRPGDRVTISAGHRRVRYVVTGVRSYPKSTGVPGQVFARGGRARLVLITCGGPFDSASGNYEANVVAYAVPRS